MNTYVCCFFNPCVDLTRCNVWILDGDLYHKGLLKFAVSAQSLSDCLAVFVVDMSRPWIIMDSLQKWSSVLRDHVDKLKIEPDVLREMEQKSESQFVLSYVNLQNAFEADSWERKPLPLKESGVHRCTVAWMILGHHQMILSCVL